MKRGLYIVTEPNCFAKQSGAGRHVQSGMNELSKAFDISLMALCEEVKQEAGNASKQVVPSWKRSYLWGTLKDLWQLLKMPVHFRRYYAQIKAEDPDFIYERAAYLNKTGLRAARLLGIPHYYEVNGLQ